MRFIEIQQIRGPRHNRHRKTLIALNGIGRVEWVPDTSESRGMIEKVSHLVHINHDPAAPNAPHVPPAYDEVADAALMRELAFDAKNIVLERYSDAELTTGKTPDFKLLTPEIPCQRPDFLPRTSGNVASSKNTAVGSE
jgi:ribosomal protein L30/L7E